MDTPDEAAAASEENPYRSPVSDSDLPASGSGFDLVLVAVMAAVVAGSWLAAPGAGVVATVLALPVAIRSLRVFHARSRRGITTTPAQKVAMVLGSLVVTAVILGGLFIGVVGSILFAIGMMCSTSRSEQAVAHVLIVIGPFTVLAAGGVLGAKWARRRWRRATQSDRPKDA